MNRVFKSAHRRQNVDDQSWDIWPWSARAAVVLFAVLLVALVVTAVILRVTLDWPSRDHEGSVLLGILLISIIPLMLLTLQRLSSRGGSLEVANIKVTFDQATRAAASTVETTVMMENLGAPVQSTPQESLDSILGALRGAHDSEVIVVDLKRGRAWLETRLFILISGAARRNPPQAVVFIGNRNGRDKIFLGWAESSRLLDAHISGNEFFAQAYERALALSLQWQLGFQYRDPGTSQPSVHLPWGQGYTQLQLPPTAGESSDPAFAMELFLQQQVEGLHPAATPRLVSIRVLLELYESVLITDHMGKFADAQAWVRLLTASRQRYFAVTNDEKFDKLLPRDALMGALVANMITERIENNS